MFKGDPEASFTKEQMHAGKHQEYEKKLHEALLQRGTVSSSVTPPSAAPSNNNNSHTNNNNNVEEKKSKSKEAPSGGGGTNKENWPQLNTMGEKDGGKDKKPDKNNELTNKDKTRSKSSKTTTTGEFCYCYFGK